MNNIIFLDVSGVVYMHDYFIQIYGGSFGIRDTGLLESALATPQASFNGSYLHTDIATMAAVYAYGLIKNHPFLDGNKRTGVGAALTFLSYNNHKILFSKNQLHAIGIAIATSKITVEQLASIFKSK